MEIRLLPSQGSCEGKVIPTQQRPGESRPIPQVFHNSPIFQDGGLGDNTNFELALRVRDNRHSGLADCRTSAHPTEPWHYLRSSRHRLHSYVHPSVDVARPRWVTLTESLQSKARSLFLPDFPTLNTHHGLVTKQVKSVMLG